MVEVFITGTIESASGFDDNQLCCRWQLQIGGGWRVVEGLSEGQTQTDLPSVFEEANFSHPIDIHLATKTILGWPRLQLQVWHHDSYGRQDLAGYGSMFIPSVPGSHQLTCHIWRPKGGVRDEMMHRFVGGGLQLVSEAVLEDPVERTRVDAIAAGSVKMHLYVITRHFDRFGIIS